MKYDYLIVGSGLYGAVFAREMTDAGKKCLVIKKETILPGIFIPKSRRGSMSTATVHTFFIPAIPRCGIM